MSTHTCVYIGDELARYGFGQGHPFGPDRLDAFWKQAQASGLDARITRCVPVSAGFAPVSRETGKPYVLDCSGTVNIS